MPDDHAEYQARRIHQVRTLPVRGVTYHLRVWGPEEGRPVFLLHGWGDSGAGWQFVVDELAQNWRVLAPDWRGFGDSGWNRGPYWFPDYLADLDTMLDLLYPQQAVDLVGHSMGGNVVLLYAAARPERVQRVANLEGFGLPDTDPAAAPRRYRRWLNDIRVADPFQTYADHAALARRLTRRNPRLPEDRALFIARHWTKVDEHGRLVIKTDPAHRWVNPTLYRRAEARACWAAVQAPVLMLLGRESHHLKGLGVNFTDSDFGLTDVRDLRKSWLEDCGHMLHWERPTAVADALVTFLQP